MANLSLADIRARLLAAENKGKEGNSQNKNQDTSMFPHWNMEEGSTATVRLLQDGDASNPDFWRERQLITLRFQGVKGDSNARNVQVKVPCVEMWNEKCPILAEVRPWYNDPVLKEQAGQYWKKRSYLFQGFVRVNPIADDVTPENPIRRFVISPQIFNIIRSSLVDPELKYLPCDIDNGRDLRIKKTTKGGYADYSTSSWSMNSTSLTDQELQAIESFGLYTLNEFLPAKPTHEHLAAMKEMFEASVDGAPYDADRWGEFYRPSGLKLETAKGRSQVGATAVQTPTVQAPVTRAAQPTPQVAEALAATAPWEGQRQVEEVPAVPVQTSAGRPDIMAAIRARQQRLQSE
jgi:hypothetical protein